MVFQVTGLIIDILGVIALFVSTEILNGTIVKMLERLQQGFGNLGY